MTFDGQIEALCAEITTPDLLREAIVEVVLACWQDSDETKETLTQLIGAVESAKLTLFMHLGDTFNE